MPAKSKVKKSAVQPVTQLTWKQVMAWRMRRHHLVERIPAEDMLAVAQDLCGLHAQVLSCAELTLWARVEGIDAGVVARALWQDRSLVKTWAMRGTLHLLPASEYPMWQAALSSYRHYESPAWFKYFGVNREELQQLMETFSAALDGKMLSRQELSAEVTRLTGSPELGGKVMGSWGSILKPASFQGRLCFGPSAGQNVRFTRPDQWLGRAMDGDPTLAANEITRRYLAAYGPANREDLARWWSVTAVNAAKYIAGLGDEVIPVDVEGTTAWMLSKDLPEIEAMTPPKAVRLLPGFDQYVVGSSRQADSMMPGAFRSRIYRQQGWISPVVLVDGRMDGVWNSVRKGNRIEVTVEEFTKLPVWARRGVEKEAGRLAQFLGGKLDLRWGNVNFSGSKQPAVISQQ